MAGLVQRYKPSPGLAMLRRTQVENLRKRCMMRTKAGTILSWLCRNYPIPLGREELMLVAGITVENRGPVCAYAAFHWQVERINDELWEFGWQVERAPELGEFYALVRENAAGR